MSDQTMTETNICITERFSLSYDLLNSMRRDNQFCDVQFAIEDKILSAHKIILASQCDFFYDMFTGDFNQSSFLTIDNDEITSNSLELLIDFIYTSRLTINDSNVKELLIASNFLFLNDVKEECLQFVKQTINIDNFMAFGDIAVLRKISDLYGIYVAFVLKNFSYIVTLNTYKSFSFETMMELIQSDDLCAEEYQVYESAIGWLKHDTEGRLKYLPELIKHIRLNQIPIDYLDHTVQQEDLIKYNVKCKNNLIGMSYLCEAYKVKYLKQIGNDEILPTVNCDRRKFTKLILVYSWKNRDCRLEWITTAENQILPKKIFTWKSSNSIILKDGRIFGIDRSLSSNIKSIIIFNVITHVWQFICDIKTKGNEGKKLFSLVELNEYVYWMTCTGSFKCFNLRKNELLDLEGIDKKYYKQFQLVVYNEYIYMVGESNVLQYSPNCDKWLVISNSGYPVLYAAICSHDGYLYVIGGIENKKYLKSVMKFHISISTWSVIANMNVPRMSAGAVVVNGLIYAIGGVHCNTYEIYDPKRDTWTLSKNQLSSDDHLITRACILISEASINPENISNFYQYNKNGS